MTDKEIMKALECCGDPYSICVECPIKADRRCNEHLANYALDIINRQQAEIKRLKNEIQTTKDAYTMLQTKNEIIKSEAVKEFAERLKEKSFQSFGNYGITRDVVEVCDIDNLLKEMESKEK